MRYSVECAWCIRDLVMQLDLIQNDMELEDYSLRSTFSMILLFFFIMFPDIVAMNMKQRPQLIDDPSTIVH